MSAPQLRGDGPLQQALRRIEDLETRLAAVETMADELNVLRGRVRAVEERQERGGK